MSCRSKNPSQLAHRWPGVGHAAWGHGPECFSAVAVSRQCYCEESRVSRGQSPGPLGPTCWVLQHMTVRRWATALTGGFSAQSGRGVSSPSSVSTCSVGRAGLHLRLQDVLSDTFANVACIQRELSGKSPIFAAVSWGTRDRCLDMSHRVFQTVMVLSACASCMG